MKKLYSIIICFLAGSYLYGQSGYQANQYMFNHQLINPAYSGKDYKIKGALLINQQLTGIESSPSLKAFSLSAPIRLSKASLGITYTNFTYGVQTNSEIYAVYSYRVPMKKWSLVYGLQGGMVSMAQTNSKLKTGQSGDEQFKTNYSGMEYNFGAGIYIFNKNSFFSVSAPAWFQHEFTSSSNIERKYRRDKMPVFISAGYEHRVNKNWWIDPYCLIRAYPNGRMMADLNLIFDYKNTFWVGPSYKTNSQMGGIVGFKLNKYLKLNYAFGISQQFRKGFIGSANEVSLVFMIKDKLNTDAISPRLF
ncbi:MAG: PorP/SprF family type IX secretion system membrane protein [Bacteroidia bacterium]